MEIDAFNRANLLVANGDVFGFLKVCDYCTEKTCPTMSGGPKFEYLWADGTSGKELPIVTMNSGFNPLKGTLGGFHLIWRNLHFRDFREIVEKTLHHFVNLFKYSPEFERFL